MTRRRLLLAVGLLAMVAALGCLPLWLTSPRHRINEESIKLIKNGMTEAEVEAIFGVPPGNYSNGGIPGYWRDPDWTALVFQVTIKQWVGETFAVGVIIDSSGKIQRIYEAEVFHVSDEPLLEKLRRWLAF